MKIIDRSYQPISVTPVLEGTALEIRIQAVGKQPRLLDGQLGDRVPRRRLTVLAEAEKL